MEQIFNIINPADVIVVIIILIFGVIGLANGFIYSIFKIVAFFASVFIAIKFYPTAAELLSKFGLTDSIQSSIVKALVKQKDTIFAKISEGMHTGTDFINNMQMPQFIKTALIKDNAGLGQSINFDTFINSIGHQLAVLMVSILALILLFILVRLALSLLKALLEGIAKLPVFKQIDKAGGFAFGVVEGLLAVYIICTVLLLFSSSAFLVPIYTSIENSKIAIYFFEKNLIAGFLFPNK